MKYKPLSSLLTLLSYLLITITAAHSHESLPILIQSLFRPSHMNIPACPIFLWNPMSFAKYKVCNCLMRGRVVEGKGGKKYVRIQPGSMLEVLYPCSQWAPDRCVLCGDSFGAHLKQWWRGQWDKPFDQFLDRSLWDAVTMGGEDFSMEADCIYYGLKHKFELKATHRRSKKHRRISAKDDGYVQLERGRPLNYHLKYLNDDNVSDYTSNSNAPRIYGRKRWFSDQGYYFAPKEKKNTNIIMLFIRRKALQRMDKLLEVQTMENFKRWEAR